MREARNSDKPNDHLVTHPEHDAVAQEVRGWFTTPAPEIGYEVGEHWYGWHGHLGSVTATQARVILAVDRPGRVPAALAEAQAASGARELVVWVDDRERAALLDPVLRASSWQPRHATTHLALVGRVAGCAGPAHLLIETIRRARMEDWARIKLQCFSDSESAPAPDRLASEIAVRLGELPLAEHQLGVLGGEGVAVLAHYRGRDQMVFNLGTRVPYRHRGIAQAMLARWADAGLASGCRSMIINAREGGQPAALYRRLGFVDEVYWYQEYAFVSADFRSGNSAPPC